MHSRSRNTRPLALARARRVGLGSEQAGLIWIWIVFGVCVLLPGAVVALHAIGGITEAVCASATRKTLGGTPGAFLVSVAVMPAGWVSLGWSTFYAASIATLASLFAWPAALAVGRTQRPIWLAVIATPILLPTYLAYAGWSIARAPTTPLGRWISKAPEHGLEWLPLVFGRGVAVWGLALWAWPLAAVVMAVGLRATGPGMMESLRLEQCSSWQRCRLLAQANKPSIAAGWGLVALLMLGSAVPLHVAKIETYAIRIWMTLDEHPGEAWRAWLTAWPLLIIAGTAGWIVSGRLAQATRHLAALTTDETLRCRVRPAHIVLAAAPWVMGVVVPFGLFWWSMGSPRALVRLIDRAGRGLATSSLIGLTVGFFAALLCLAAAHTASTRRSKPLVLRGILAVFLAWTILPGVLVGAAIAQIMRMPALPQPLSEGALPMVIAHLSRVAFLPILVGLWLGASEGGAIAETRQLEKATGLAPWAATSLRAALGPALAVGLACACLSFHEIESSIQVQPPGIDHMAQRLLQWLHYARMTELSAAGVLLLGVGMATAGSALLGLNWWKE